MLRRVALICFILGLAGLLAAPTSAGLLDDRAVEKLLGERGRDPAADQGSEMPKEWIAPDRVVVGYQANHPLALATIESAAHRLGARVIRIDGRLNFAVVKVPADMRDTLIARLRAQAGILYAKPDAIVKGYFTPNDPLYTQQWGPPAIGMPSAWDTSLGTHDRMVAVIDTGVMYDHPDLAGNYCAAATDIDLVNGDNDPMDDHGHGTHVAGTVAAEIDNAAGVAGMANTCLMGVKVLDGGGSGNAADVASGIAHATANGAHITSMSLGGCPGCDPGEPMTSAVQNAWANGVLNVAAAGNAFCSPVGYPAAYPEVMAVASLDEPGTSRSIFSSCGPEVEIAAPGRDIISTWNDGGYNTISGTSMATPHVSGVAALVWSQDTTLSNASLRCILRDTSDDLGPPDVDPEYGAGRVDADEAIALPGPNPGCGGLWPEPPPPPEDGFCTLPCVEDFDDGSTDHATTTGLWHISDACAAAPSAPSYLGFNLDPTCTYQTGLAEAGAYTIWADTTGVEFAALRFSHKHATEELFPFDAMRVEASVNGLTWSPVADYTGQQATDWAAVSLNVSAFLGGQVRFRFLFDSVDQRDNAHLGWLIDDVRLEEPPPTSDMRITDINVAPSEAVVGDEVTFAAVVANTGEVDAPASTTRFALDGSTLADVSTPALAKGETTTVQAQWTAMGAGLHTLIVTADVLDEVAEDIREENNTLAEIFEVIPVPCTLPCTESFDAAAPGSLGLNGLWHVSNACGATPSLPNYLGYNQDSTCDFDTGGPNAGEATLFVDLTGESEAALAFNHRHQTEAAAPWDAMRVEVSTDAGASWQTLADYTGQAPISWRAQVLNLTPYVGGVVRVRWRFDTVDEFLNDGLGWLIDDVTGDESPSLPPPPPPCAGGNDNLSDACEIQELPYSNEQSTIGFTEETGEIQACNGRSTAWYEYTHIGAPATVTVETFGSTFDTTLGVYLGPFLLGCNDDSAGTLQSSISFTALPGLTYHVQAGGFVGQSGKLKIDARAMPTGLPTG